MEAKEFLSDVIKQETAKGPRQLREVISGVENRVAEVHDAARSQVGDLDILASYKAETEAWKSGINYDKSLTIDEIGEKEGAAGMHNMNSRQTTLDAKSLELNRDDAYWKRVEAHEKEGHGNQAVNYNRNGLQFDGKEVGITALVEWDAITVSNQPDSDLTDDYKAYRAIGERIAARVGKGVLHAAMRSGDLQSVQDKLDIENIRAQLGIPENVVLGEG